MSMAQKQWGITPTPKKAEGSGEYRAYEMGVCCGEDQWTQAAELFMNNLEKTTGLERGGRGEIVLRRVEGMAEEAYRIEIGEEVLLTASGAMGMNHGLATHNDICVVPTEQVIGGQLCLWGDVLHGYGDDLRAAREEFELAVPRAVMLAHRTWNAKVEPDSSRFTARMKAGDMMKAMRRI